MAFIPTHRFGDNPTLDELTVALREEGRPEYIFVGLTAEEVLAACKARDVPVKDGRVLLNSSRGGNRMSEVYFGIANGRGIETRVPQSFIDLHMT